MSQIISQTRVTQVHSVIFPHQLAICPAFPLLGAAFFFLPSSSPCCTFTLELCLSTISYGKLSVIGLGYLGPLCVSLRTRSHHNYHTITVSFGLSSWSLGWGNVPSIGAMPLPCLFNKYIHKWMNKRGINNLTKTRIVSISCKWPFLFF